MSRLSRQRRRQAIRQHQLTVPTSPARLPEAAIPHYWSPRRYGIQYAPDWFRTKLHAVLPTLEVVWSPYHERWLVWEQSPNVTHRFCAGWSLKFLWQGAEGEYLPLDERLLADLYARDFRRYGGAVRYFDRLVSEMEDDLAKQKTETTARIADIREDYLQYRRIKNIGRGSKFALHHDGSVVPSAGEIVWRQQQARHRATP